MKGQGLPLNTIIIAIIALVVLFVVIMIFRGVSSEPGNLYNECETGIYADFSCIPKDDPAASNPLCIPDKCNDAEKRCCPNAER